MSDLDLTMKLRAGRTRWNVRPACADYFVGHIVKRLDGLESMNGNVIKSNPVRTLLRFEGGGECPPFVLKIYRVAGLLRRLKETLLGANARRENDNLLLLAGSGVATPLPIACGVEKAGPMVARSFLATEEVEGAQTLKELLQAAADDDPQRNRLLLHAAQMTAALDQTGLVHRDLHLGNILLDGAGRPILIDLQRARKPSRPSPAQRGTNLRQMAYSVYHTLGEGGVDEFLECYADCAGQDPPDAQSLHEETWASIRKYRRIHMASRTRRCLRTSSGFAVSSVGRGRLYHVKDAGVDLKEILDRHKASVEAGLYIKKTDKIVLTRINIKNRNRAVVVKQYMPSIGSSLLAPLRGGRLRREWMHTHGLHVRGIGAPRPLALYETGAKGEAFLITEYLEGFEPLNEAIESLCSADADWDERRRLLAALAEFIAHIHTAEVYHHDLKANNVMAHRAPKEEYEFALLDTDRVSFGKPVTQQQIVNNLAYLNAAIGNHLPDTDRLRFMKYYHAAGGPTVSKDQIRQIVSLSIQRDHFWRPSVR